MNYPRTTTSSMQPLTATMSLPPISSIDFRSPPLPPQSPDRTQPMYHQSPPRQFPVLAQPHIGGLPPREYGHPPPSHLNPQMPPIFHQNPGPMPIPPTVNPGIMIAPVRQKPKDVKRRTKTGCLTCRKRRIKCDEARPDCKNCVKSKRQCLGYDPLFQPQGLYAPRRTPISQSASNPSSSTSTAQSWINTVTPSSPSSSSHSTLQPISPRDRAEASFPQPLEPLLSKPPHSAPSFEMDSSSHPGIPPYPSLNRPRHSIEEICTIAGTKIPSIPPIPPDSVPNLESIRKVYDIAFAAGLDKFLESDQHWFAKEGFNLLANNRQLLGLVLAYLTLVSTNYDAPLGSNDTLLSQESRVTWALLSLCSRTDQNTDGSGAGEEADKLTRRFRILESILTGEPLTSTAASMSEFLHQEDPDPSALEEPVLDPIYGPESKPTTAFDKQVARRTEEFWKVVENIAIAQGRGEYGTSEIETGLSSCRALTDGMENRDVIYSMLLLGWGKNGDPSSERELAKRYLQTESGGRATNQVFATVAGMTLRAFEA